MAPTGLPSIHVGTTHYGAGLTDPEVVEPVVVLVVTPLAAVVPPSGPVTEPDSVAPVRVFVTVPCALAVLSRALVAVPLAVTVLRLVETEAVALPPRGPVTVCCACVEATANTKVRTMSLLLCGAWISNFLREAVNRD